MATLLSERTSFSQPKLEINGVGIKQWTTDVMNHITSRWGPDLGRFIRDKYLPSEHTQCSEQRYKMSHGGVIIANKMPGMLGTFVDVDKKIPIGVVKCMTEEEKSCLKKIGNAYYGVVKKNVPVVYNKLYEGDPYANERVAVHQDEVEMLTKFEADWVAKMAGASADVVNWLSPALRFRMENLGTFCKHRDNYRPEMMIQDVVEMVVSANAGEVVEKCQMSITILGLLDKLQSMRLEQEEDINVFLNRYDENVQRLLVLGYNNREIPLPHGEDTIDYFFGVNLIRSVAGDRFDELITKDDNDKLLRSPICTYAWARNRITKWSDELKTSFKNVINGNKNKRKSNGDVVDSEIMSKKATIMMEKVYNHGNQINKNKNNSGSGTVVTSTGTTSVGTNSDSSEKFAAWKKNRTCRNCHELGHFDSECPKATEEQRAMFYASYLERREKNKDRKRSK